MYEHLVVLLDQCLPATQWPVLWRHRLGCVRVGWVQTCGRLVPWLHRPLDVSPTLIYLVTIAQGFGAVGVLRDRFAFWAAVGLTATSLGAVVCHWRIGSPQTSIAAVVFTGIQVWFAWRVRRS